MLDRIRRTLEDLVNGTLPPEERRAAVARMKATLVAARMGLDDVRRAIAETRARLDRERAERDTARRRGALAAGINDRETVSVADRFARQHEERAALLERKLDLQVAELAAAERDVEEMTREMKGVVAGTSGATPTREGADRTPSGGSRAAPDPHHRAPDATDDDAGLRDELDAIARARSRATRDAAADEQLAALKRRMGK